MITTSRVNHAVLEMNLSDGGDGNLRVLRRTDNGECVLTMTHTETHPHLMLTADAVRRMTTFMLTGVDPGA